MKSLPFAAALLSLSLFTLALPAAADNIADCEIVLVETIEDESGNGSAQIASYRPAADFIASAYDDTQEIMTELDGLAIRALLCRRNDVIISETDFKLLASGVPFVLSQNFDSPDSDLLTYFFKDSQFQYTHKGQDLSKESLAILDAHMADFNNREDVIAALDAARAAKAEAAASEDIVSEDALAEDISGEDTREDTKTLDETAEVLIADTNIDENHVKGEIADEDDIETVKLEIPSQEKTEDK